MGKLDDSNVPERTIWLIEIEGRPGLWFFSRKAN